MSNSVSILIPTFNRAELLKKAIDSALVQTTGCEVVVADHGSTDHTPEVCAKYGSKINYIRRERDDGPIVAWLDGAIRSNGEYLHITHDDDWIEPDYVAKCLVHFTPDVGLVFSNARIVSADHQDSFLYPLNQPVLRSNSSDELIRHLFKRGLAISPGCAMFRRKDVIAALMSNPAEIHNAYHGAGPDMMLFLYCAFHYPNVRYEAEPLAVFRSHEGSITVDASRDAEKGAGLAAAYSEYRRFISVTRLMRNPMFRLFLRTYMKLVYGKSR